jgi:hypothetical protein
MYGQHFAHTREKVCYLQDMTCTINRNRKVEPYIRRHNIRAFAVLSATLRDWKALHESTIMEVCSLRFRAHASESTLCSRVSVNHDTTVVSNDTATQYVPAPSHAFADTTWRLRGQARCASSRRVGRHRAHERGNNACGRKTLVRC